MEENGSRGVGSVIVSFFLGGLIGAGVALLVAPKAGRETREQIRGLVKDKAGDYYEQITEAVTSTLESGKGLLDEKKQLIMSAVQAGIALYQKKQGKTETSGQERSAQPM